MHNYTGTVEGLIVFVFVDVLKVESGNAVYAASDFDSGGGKTFDAAKRCSLNGQEPASHLMVSHVVDQQFLDGILIGVNNPPFFNLYKTSDGFTIDSSLADMVLQIINEVV